MAEAEDELASQVLAAVRASGFEPTQLTWLPAELSLRRFARVHTSHPETPRLVARVEAPEDPAGRPAGAAPEPPHEPIRALLERHGLPVPRRYGADAAHGIELLEDVGEVALRDAAARVAPAERRRLYREACRLVSRLQAIDSAPGVAAFERRLDAALIAYKADLFVRHALRARGRAASPAEADAVHGAFSAVAREAEAAPQRLAHRDLQGANVYVRDGTLAWIDLQGACLAPPEYDLVCLLRDSYVALPEAEIAAHVEAVRPTLPDAPDAGDFERRFDLLTLTRKGKDLARFLYAARERGDARYLEHVPVTLEHLRGAAGRSARRDPRFAPLAELIHQIPESPC